MTKVFNVIHGRICNKVTGDPFRLKSGAPLVIDLNSDRAINASDAVWSDLVVWKDVNQDGYLQSDELLTMGSPGIAQAAMFNQMLKKYWKSMPETILIQDLPRQSETRARRMIKASA